MKLFKQFNSFLEKKMYLIIITGIVCGFIFQNQFLAAKAAVPWVFGVMTFSLSLGTGFKDLKQAVSSPLPLLLLLFCLHGISPLFAYTLGRTAYGQESLITAGLLLVSIVPVGVSSVIWSAISGGDIPLSLTAVTLDSLASPVTVPLVISIFLGKSLFFDATDMIASLLQMIVFPTLCGVFIHDIYEKQIQQKRLWFPGFISKLGLAFVVGVNVSASREYVVSAGAKLLPLFILLVLLVIVNFALGYFISSFVGFPRSIVRTYTFSMGIRNISAGIVIALNYFPPETALPVVLALLLQQPSAGFVRHLLDSRAP